MKRSRFDIMADIMQYCLLPKRKTQIMLRGNLAFSQANSYLGQLVASELIRPHKAEYRTTRKGEQFLLVYNRLVLLLRESTVKIEEGDSVREPSVYMKLLMPQSRYTL